jgi:F-type H+-transporting ATPase subunit b
MRIDWWTLGFQTVNVLVLVWLLSRFLFKPVAKIVADRQQAASALMRDATAARDAAERDRQQAADAAAALDTQRAGRLSDASADAERLHASLLAAARTEADALRVAAADGIATMRRNASQADAARAAGFALEIASRLLARLPPDALVAGFIDPLADAVRALPEEDRRQLGLRRDPLRLIAPRALSDDEQARCRAALSAALGYDAALRIDVDPSLIAGLELDARYAIVRNSFRCDLAAVKAELLSDDDERHPS